MNINLDKLEMQRTVVDLLLDYHACLPSGSGSSQDQWRAAIATISTLLLDPLPSSSANAFENASPSSPVPLGLVLASPSPIFDAPEITQAYRHVLLTPKGLHDIALSHFQLPAASASSTQQPLCTPVEFPLLPNDPLAEEQFCVVLTPKFNLAIALGEQGFLFSFDPEAIAAIWQLLHWRLALTQPFQFPALAENWQQLSGATPDYRIVTHFSQLLLGHLSRMMPTSAVLRPPAPAEKNEANSQSELELLQAFTHEIRTPLTTILTMAKLLLRKRTQLAPEMIKRIETIEQECNEQISRMELIFRAVELENSPQADEPASSLVPSSLEYLLQEGISRWQKQAQRRQVALHITLPPALPQVVCDVSMLDQVLSGLIETFTRRLPPDSEMHILVGTAGDQLKLELQSHGIGQKCLEKAIGQLLIFQPETGSLSLNFKVTKNLFHHLGGRLAIRRRTSGEEVLAIFLPLDSSFALPL